MTTAMLTRLILGAAIAARKADHRNRYALREPWTLPLLDPGIDLPPYDGPLIRVEPVGERVRITVKPYSGDVCDGATFAPDWPRGALHAALFHDPWYLEIPAMAAAWGWSEDRVRRAGDGILATVMLRARGNPWLTRLYYNAVWHFGGLFRRLRRRATLALVAVLLALAAFAGCQPPPDWSDPTSPYVPPVYERAPQ